MRATALCLRVASTIAFACATANAARAQVSDDEMNASNNPLTPSIAFNLQNYYTVRAYGLGDAGSNAFLLRGALPHKLFGMSQLLRVTLPVVTTPDLPPVGRHTGLGDLNIFDIVLFKESGFEWGIGPQLTIPTASRDEQGTGKWQAGLAATVIVPQRWGLLGGLLTWQHSFAGDDDRPTQNNMQVQPLVIYNLPQGWYFRSTAVWTFDFARDTHVIPVGAGLGKIWKSGATTLNAFVEPQWSVSHDGNGLPQFQVFFGLNLQFPL